MGSIQTTFTSTPQIVRSYLLRDIADMQKVTCRYFRFRIMHLNASIKGCDIATVSVSVVNLGLYLTG